jgi:hypothetical protein
MIEKLTDKVVALESNSNGLSSNATFKTEGTHTAAPLVGRLLNNFIEPISVESYTHDKGNAGPPMKPLPVPIPSLSASMRDHMIPSTVTPRALTTREGSTVNTTPSAAASVPRPQSARLPSRKPGIDRDDGKDRGGSLVRASTNPNVLAGVSSSSNSTGTFLPSSSSVPAWGGGMGWTSGFVSHKFTWSVLNFSGLPNRMVSGPPFTVGNYTFHINLHPWGVSQASRSHLSLYLVLDGLADEGDMSDVAQVPVKYSLILNNQIDEEHSYIQVSEGGVKILSFSFSLSSFLPFK